MDGSLKKAKASKRKMVGLPGQPLPSHIIGPFRLTVFRRAPSW